jgi:hypothetical protein
MAGRHYLLLCAFATSNVFVFSLMSALIFTSDNSGRNILHLLLGGASDNPALGGHHKLGPLFESMDVSTRRRLLEQRCSEATGGHTPFARWMYAISRAGVIRLEADGLFKTVLEMSDSSTLERLHLTWLLKTNYREP